jgi:hypothetical protein
MRCRLLVRYFQKLQVLRERFAGIVEAKALTDLRQSHQQYCKRHYLQHK